VTSGFPFFAKHVETILEEGTHTGPFVTSALSFVDVLTYCICGSIADVAKTIGKEDPSLAFPKLSALIAAVADIPQVAAFENRPIAAKVDRSPKEVKHVDPKAEEEAAAAKKIHVDPVVFNKDDMELVYFNAAGRAQPTRLVLSIGGVSFKDTRLSFPEFGALAGSGELPLQTVPVLKMGGRIVASQSGAILRAAAELAGLGLHSAEDVLRGEDVANTMVDIGALWGNWFGSSAESKDANASDLVTSGFPFFAKHVETILEEGTHTGPFVTSALSFVDVLTYCICGYIADVAKTIGKEDPSQAFPKLSALIAAVRDHEAVQRYEKRQ
jgi:glutathione S-transferase